MHLAKWQENKSLWPERPLFVMSLMNQGLADSAAWRASRSAEQCPANYSTPVPQL